MLRHQRLQAKEPAKLACSTL